MTLLGITAETSLLIFHLKREQHILGCFLHGQSSLVSAARSIRKNVPKTSHDYKHAL